MYSTAGSGVNCAQAPQPSAQPLPLASDLEGREVPGAGGEPARSLAQFIRDEGLSLARTQVAVDYSYWPAHAVLQVCGGRWVCLRTTLTFHCLAGL